MTRSVLVLSAALLAAAAAPAHAQFAVRGGMNLSRFVGQDAAQEDRTGLNLGASVPLLHFSAVSIVPEIYYAQKGGREIRPSGLGAVDFELSYIEVPILARLRLPVTRWLHAYAAGGPAFAWNVDCRFSSVAGANTSDQACGEQFQNFQTAMSSADRGVVVGGGLDFAVGGFGGLNLDARLVRGLARLRDEGSSDVKNQSVSLMLGYYLGR